MLANPVFSTGLAGRRIAIVDDVAGVTRDRLSQLVEFEDRYFEVVDTGGIGIEDVDNLTREIEEQISMAIDSADVILFVVDTRSGITPLDELVAQTVAERRQARSSAWQTKPTMSNWIRRRMSSIGLDVASC